MVYQELLNGSFCVRNCCVAVVCIKSCHYDSGVTQEPSCVSAVYQAQMCGCNVYWKSCMTVLWIRNYCIAVNTACVSSSNVPVSHHHTPRLCLVPTREETFFFFLSGAFSWVCAYVRDYPSLRQQWWNRKFLLRSGRTGDFSSGGVLMD
jgi:hypothetical protein